MGTTIEYEQERCKPYALKKKPKNLSSLFSAEYSTIPSPNKSKVATKQVKKLAIQKPKLLWAEIFQQRILRNFIP